jgi:hypothetical protein
MRQSSFYGSAQHREGTASNKTCESFYVNYSVMPPEQEFSEEAVRAVLRELTPRNLRMMLSSKRFKVR